MTYKQIVLSKYPKAVAIEYPQDWGWCVFKRPTFTGKGALNLLGGYSEKEAWKESALTVSKLKKGQQ